MNLLPLSKKDHLGVLVLFILFYFVSIIVVYNVVELFEKKRLQTILDSHINTIETVYNVLSHNQKITADTVFAETVQNKQFMKIFEKANQAKLLEQTNILNGLRSQALEIFTKKYQLYKQLGIFQYNFVFPDNKVFLRMHKTNKHSDDLSDVRLDFDYVNRSLKIVRGFAQGRTAHAFRHVYPIVNENKKHLGAVEISFSSELLQNYFTKINHIHTHFLVRKDIFQSHAWKRDDLILVYQQSSEHENYMITMTDEHTKDICIVQNGKKISQSKETIKSKMELGKPFSIATLIQTQGRVITFYPILHNVTFEPVAWIVSYVDDPIVVQTFQVGNILFIMLSIIVFTILSFIYFLLYQKNMLKILVDEKTQHLLKLNKELQESEHELQLINENLEHTIQEEVDKNRQKDKILFEQTKMAALGEMIGNIAHQWRQPLSVISSSATAIEIENEMGLLDEAKIKERCSSIDKNAQYLSRTIDDFRNFIRGNSKAEKFDLQSSIDSFLNLIEPSAKQHQIKIDVQIEPLLSVIGYKNELNQALINLFQNSKDAFVERDIDNRKIFLKAFTDENNLEIEFYDNAGGISENIIDKVFEPYFTTKHQSIGTGLGLHMTYKLIVEVMKGSITIHNQTFNVDNQKHTGAVFNIQIPI